MIAGIGTDICRVSRMKRAIKSDHFVRRLFSDEEIEYASSQGEPARHYASAYAAKEALAKACGLGMFGMGIDSVWVSRTDSGPVINLGSDLKKRFDGMGISKCWLSLTHEGDYAMAFVVLETMS